MNIPGTNIFRLIPWDNAKKVFLSIYYVLCVIPYVYMLIGQPFRCIASSFFISLTGVFILFAVRQKESTGSLGWAIYLAFAPGFFLFILSPFLLLRQISDMMQID